MCPIFKELQLLAGLYEKPQRPDPGWNCGFVVSRFPPGFFLWTLLVLKFMRTILPLSLVDKHQLQGKQLRVDRAPSVRS